MSFLKKKYSLTTALAEKFSKLSSRSSYAEEYVSEGEEDLTPEGSSLELSGSSAPDATYRRELKTKARYPVTLDLPQVDGIPPLTFVGTGLRSETFMTMEFWIYTIGMYVEPSEVRGKLGSFKSCEPGTLHENEDFCRSLISMKGVTRVLRFVITLPGLKAGIVVSQFDKVLLPKMQKKGKEKEYRYIMENMGKAKFRKGTKMFLALSGEGEVTCVCNGEILGAVKCDELCESIMEIYFGDVPVSEDVKEKICNGVHAALQDDFEE